MFFTPELLARRDSGFGLLWLAATLGSKSTFKRLPKRTVLTADIAQLCNLIVQPNEPLALRLSSNLMMGVARIFKVKQEILFSDVSNCVASLKKAVYELRALGEEQLQMGQPTLRSAALTLPPDPKNAFMMEFDMLVADWDEYLDLGQRNASAFIEEEADYDPSLAKKVKVKPRRPLVMEVGNVSAHTLVEHHEHVLSTCFDLSASLNVNNQRDSIMPSSGNEDFGFADFFPVMDGPAIGDVLGDELARELGWGSPPPPDDRAQFASIAEAVDLPINPEPDEIFGLIQNDFDDRQSINRVVSRLDEHGNVLNIQNEFRGRLSPTGVPQTHVSAQPLGDITNTGEVVNVEAAVARPRPKSKRLLLDPRTELTDDELKTARMQYIHIQAIQRQETINKQLAKACSRLVDERMLGAPAGVAAPALADFWQGTLKARLTARAGNMFHEERPRKRRRTQRIQGPDTPLAQLLDGVGQNQEEPADEPGGQEFQAPETIHYRSSEEPGQGRYASRPQSALGSHAGIEVGLNENFVQSQQDFMFPWDNAGPSSPDEGVPFGFPSSNQISVEHADVRLRGSSRSRRESPLSPSNIAVNLAADGFSPAPIGRGSHGIGEDYEFDVRSHARTSVVGETRQNETPALAVEKNSLNFLEYAKMQFKTLPNSAQDLSFETIVPKSTSTRHVAAAAFYHCLVLGTKDLLRFKQTEPHGRIDITISK